MSAVIEILRSVIHDGFERFFSLNQGQGSEVLSVQRQQIKDDIGWGFAFGVPQIALKSLKIRFARYICNHHFAV
ncbi:hypothetical protein SDC9_187677 [bioreactor metagenome]|uniref:Uncharacterized protein n=1 Tax=bioreactor metagenome TaxID=1076179 RepID=A0A645HM71_9ZZZZ